MNEDVLRNDPEVQRLLNNSNWSGAANAAIAYFIHGTTCTIPSRRSSSTWAQVKMAYEKLSRRAG